MSTARRRQLGSWLVKLRGQAGLDVEAAARHLGCSVSKIRHMEAGRSKAKKNELSKLLDFYAVSTEVRHQLEEIRQQAEQRGWWEPYRLPEWFGPFVDFESYASEALNFELDLVPGLLQIEQYAYEIHRAGRYTTNPPDIARRVKARMQRQRRLDTDPPLRLRAVVAEAAFRRVVGGPEVMRAQLDHVIKRCALQNIIVQVLPYAAGAHASPSGAFAVLAFHGHDENVGFLDTPLGGQLIDDEQDVAALHYIFDELRARSLSPQDSLELLRTIRDCYDDEKGVSS